jgi:hypothetical protein
VPSNGLSFAVLIGGQIELIRLGQSLLELGYGFTLSGRDCVVRLKVVFDVN